MRAGTLRHRIELQHSVDTQDSVTGEIIKEWVTKAKPWARFEFLSVRDFMAGQANQSQISARVVIRHREDISHTDRIIYKGKIYDIEGILPDNDSGVEYLTIPVSEGVRHV